MNKINFWREAAKLAAGLVLADFLVGAWVMVAGMLPLNFFGMTVTTQGTWWWMGLDVVLFCLLAYYAWHRRGEKDR